MIKPAIVINRHTNVNLSELLVLAGLAKTERECREYISNGVISVNGKKVTTDIDFAPFEFNWGVYIQRGKNAHCMAVNHAETV